ncbi:MAG: formylglycine-generating enzyme family protein [Deltaproteobacteria bacterium]|nr:formylglycine-generating enzyme family protein [Deltaproteobacteria bacterium]
MCSTTSECTDALGAGWACISGCCEQPGGGDDDDDDDDDAGDDDTTGLGDDDFAADLSWVSLEGAFFTMGCTEGDIDCLPSESPSHTVWVSAFEMTETEITQEQYFAVTASNPSDNSGCEDCPVNSVDWNAANDYCVLAGGRLPSEAEWEYAARAWTETIYSCGDGASCLDEVAWYADNAEGATHPVGTKSPNDFDLYDMHGNAAEWTRDWYAEAYYEESPQADPPGPASGTDRVVRGGSWAGDPWALRASYRAALDPDAAYYLVGFRCVRGGAP